MKILKTLQKIDKITVAVDKIKYLILTVIIASNVLNND